MTPFFGWRYQEKSKSYIDHIFAYYIKGVAAILLFFCSFSSSNEIFYMCLCEEYKNERSFTADKWCRSFFGLFSLFIAHLIIGPAIQFNEKIKKIVFIRFFELKKVRKEPQRKKRRNEHLIESHTVGRLIHVYTLPRCKCGVRARSIFFIIRCFCIQKASLTYGFPTPFF